MTDLVEYIAKSLVNEPEKVGLTEVEEDGEKILVLTVAPDDMGKVIGKKGRIAKAIRTLIKAASYRTGEDTRLEIVSEEEYQDLVHPISEEDALEPAGEDQDD